MQSKTTIFMECNEKHWTEVMKEVEDALVFMDDASAECLHWHGGLKRVLDNGAINVENFTPFVNADSKVKKVVFVLTSPLVGETWKTIAIILRANSFQNCIVLSSLPPRCHSEITDTTNPIFDTLETQLCSWINNKNFSARILHIPFGLASVTQSIFIMPSFSKSFSIYKCGVTEMNIKKTEEVSLKTIPADIQASIKQLTCSLISLLDTYQFKGDFFSLGTLSHILCTELENLSHQQKKSYSTKASMVIVDRLLDLAGPLSQSYETMLDKILLALPHIPGHTFDVSVPMNDLASCKSDSVFGRSLLAQGCLAHKNNSFEECALNAILYKKPRETLIEVNRNLVECAAREKIDLDLSSHLTSHLLKQHVRSFKQRPESIGSNGLLQQVLAIVQALDYSSSQSVDNLSATEKALLQYLATSPEEVLSNIMQMISEKEELNYKMEDILIFLAFFYMLSGETDLVNESAMQATLMEEFFQDKCMNELSSLFVDGKHDDELILNTVRSLFGVFKRLGAVRKRFKKYSTLFKSSNPAFPSSYNPLLKQLLDDVFNTAVADIPDVEFHSSGLRDYIKTGFSLFMNVTKPQPRDNPVIFLIVLGGVTASEIKLIHDISSKRKETEVILGCMNILTPHDVLKDFGQIVKELVENY